MICVTRVACVGKPCGWILSARVELMGGVDRIESRPLRGPVVHFYTHAKEPFVTLGRTYRADHMS